MPGIPLAIRVELGPAQELLADVGARAADLRPVWNDVVDPDFSAFGEQQFATEGAAGGTPWAPLSPATVTWKARFGRAGMGILRFFNRLWSSLTKRGGEDSLRLYEPLAAHLGTSVPY